MTQRAGGLFRDQRPGIVLVAFALPVDLVLIVLRHGHERTLRQDRLMFGCTKLSGPL